MAISNFNGTTAKFFKIGDITIYSGLTPYDYDDLGKDGDIFISSDGTRYSKTDGIWQIQMNQYSGTEIPDNTLGENGDLYRLLSSNGISGSKYIKVNDTTVEPAGIKWMATTNELYSKNPNNELFNELDLYEASDGEYVKVNGKWVKVESRLSGSELPVAKIGNNGDIYHDTSLDRYYFKADGSWYEITTRYTQTDIPNDLYGVNNDIWLGGNNKIVYVKENNAWVDKTTTDKVCGGNGIVLDDFYPDKSIITSYERAYYLKLNGEWDLVGKIYHDESIPSFYTGENGDICLNNNNSTVWFKNNDVWAEGTLLGYTEDAPAQTYGENGSICYTQFENTFITNDAHVYNADIKTYTTIPTSSDGSVGDVYNVNATNYYKDDNSNWNILSASYYHTSNPITCDNDNLNNYLYIVNTETPKTFVCNNREWYQIVNMVSSTTEPSGFDGKQNDIYITSDDKYFVFTTGWMPSSIKTYNTEPDSNCGVDYDIYQMETKKLAKIDNNWVNISSGNSLSGDDEPDINIGNVYDIYHDNTNDKNYIKVEIDEWKEIGNIYNYMDAYPPASFWNPDTIYQNTSDVLYIKNSGVWVLANNLFDAGEELPPASYWSDYTLYTTNSNKYVRFNGSWNEIEGELVSTDTPNNNMWVKGVSYNNSTNTYIKTGATNWILNNEIYYSTNKPEDNYWGTNVIYETQTKKYIKTNETWELALNEISTYQLPDNLYGANGTVFITADYNYYLKINSVWRRISNVFDKNTAPKYNSYGANNSMYELGNNNAFTKQNGIWVYAFNIIEGSEPPFNDVGKVGTLFDLSTDNKTYVLYSDYSWRLAGNQYNQLSNPLDTDGAYLWLYIKSDTNMVYNNGTTWVDINDINKSNNLPTQAEGSLNDLWIVLSTGLYVKDSGEWSKIQTAGTQELNARQEIYLFT